MARQLKDLPLPHTLLSLALVSQLGLAAYGREYRVLIPLIPFTAIPLVSLSKESRTKDWIKETLETTAQDGIAWELLQQLRGHKEPQAVPKDTANPPETPKATLEEPKVPYADLGDLKANRDQYPHIAILGKTGSGKSTLVNRLLAYTSGTDTVAIAIAPHWEAGDYSNVDLILGSGRNYGEDARDYLDELRDPKNDRVIQNPQGEPEIDFRAILAGDRLNTKVTCCQFVRALVSEMDRRYQLTPEGRFCWREDGSPKLEIVLDEFPAWGSLPGVSECLSKLLRESRKVGIRLYLLIQGAEVKSMGIEGQGSLREQLVFFRGRGFIQGVAGVTKCPVGGIVLPPESPTLKELQAFSHPWLMEESIVLPSGNASLERIPPDSSYFQRVPNRAKMPPKRPPQESTEIVTNPTIPTLPPGNSIGNRGDLVTDLVTLSDTYGTPVETLEKALAAIKEEELSDSKIVKTILGYVGSNGNKSYARGKELLRELKNFLDT